MNSAAWIKHLKMSPHPEGGSFSPGFSDSPLFLPHFPGQRHQGYRRLFSSIYYLLEEGDFSAFHRLETDEMWHHYQGGVLKIYLIDASGALSIKRLGNDPEGGAVFQFLTPHHVWFAVEPEIGSEFALCGCTLSPGYDDDDFELADREKLLTLFPQHHELITRLTR
ncbi:MAG TPA: hypothetical protein DCR43_02385 [Bacteroidales bacterium]|nr:MAG: hypothetical protein A2X11_07505 [Bacteroidetes bacterium GWE2_42_24]OFY29497.1 MAG: hypothetical protein A2X09_04095 [Bacteroidetes bacterium GWF2_43_11]HAQ64696.1 hypothetical protein [Bacteroidales bacterium]HBZ67292.1 hypothetical protein [Bacteroidales bacterium]